MIGCALAGGGLRLTILARVLAVLAWLWVGVGLGLGSGLGLGLGLGFALQHLEHGQVSERAVAEARDVEEGDLVRVRLRVRVRDRLWTG